ERLDLAILFGADGSRSQQDVIEKYKKDARVLEAALREEPHNERYAFYLAQSYRDSQQLEKAVAAYDRRAKMGGFDQEVYWSHLQAGRIARGLGHPVPELIDRFLRAYDARPSRVEALGDLAALCREGSRWASALLYAEKGLATPPAEDVLFAEPEWHRWRLLDEQSIALYWLGRHEESLAVCDQLLAGGQVPANQVER